MIESKAFNLDVKDRKILYELDLDSRQPLTKLAKKVGLSTEVVNYRVKRLESIGIIRGYQLIVNLSKMGIIQFKLCLSFKHLESSKLNEIIKKIKQIKEAKWIVSCNGRWDLIISMETNSLEEIGHLKDEVFSLFKNYIDKKSISIGIEISNYNRTYFLENRVIKKERVIIDDSKKIKLNELDLKIIKKLSENARKSIVDLAEELKISERIVNYRIKQLIKSRVINGFKLMIDYEKLGLQFYKTFIYLGNPKMERVDVLIKYFDTHKNIVHHVKVLGNWDLEPEFEVSSEKEFNEILTEMKDRFSDIISKVEIITISKEHKFVYL